MSYHEPATTVWRQETVNHGAHLYGHVWIFIPLTPSIAAWLARFAAGAGQGEQWVRVPAADAAHWQAVFPIRRRTALVTQAQGLSPLHAQLYWDTGHADEEGQVSPLCRRYDLHPRECVAIYRAATDHPAGPVELRQALEQICRVEEDNAARLQERAYVPCR
jgi:hypothetical protein